MIVIPIANQHAYNKIPRNQTLGLQISNHCNSPSRVLVVDWKGDCFVCSCESWLPVSVGKIQDFTALDSIWQSTAAQTLQQDIDDRKFTHCAVDRCGVANGDIHYNEYLISINIDESCNLYCPSCRKSPIMLGSGKEFDSKLQQVTHLVRLLEEFDKPCRVVMSGNGDPLASAIMRPLLHKWHPKPTHKIRLFTNGLLLKKQLEGNSILPAIDQYFLSIDAGSRDVYERVRLGGLWSKLLENLDWLSALSKQQPIRVLLMLVLQKENYQDIENFCQLVVGYGFEGSITYLEDWGTWDNFATQDVIGNCTHPEHQQALEMLRKCYEKYKNSINFGSRLISLVADD